MPPKAQAIPSRMKGLCQTTLLRSLLDCVHFRQKLRKFIAKIVACQGKSDSCLQEARFGTAVIAFPSEPIAKDIAPGVNLSGDGIGQLDFPTGAAPDMIEVLQDLWRQDITPDHCQIGGRGAHRRLFNHPADLHNPPILARDIQNTV